MAQITVTIPDETLASASAILVQFHQLATDPITGEVVSLTDEERQSKVQKVVIDQFFRYVNKCVAKMALQNSAESSISSEDVSVDIVYDE